MKKKLLFLSATLLTMTLTSCGGGGTVVSTSSSKDQPIDSSSLDISSESSTNPWPFITSQGTSEDPVGTSVLTSEEPVISESEEESETHETGLSTEESGEESKTEEHSESAASSEVSSETEQSSESAASSEVSSETQTTTESGEPEFDPDLPSYLVDESTGDIYFNGKLRIWYHRDDLTYTDLVIYLWNASVDGEQYEFNGTDAEYGKYFEMNLWENEQFHGHVSNDIRMIIKKRDTWSGQSADTFLEFKDFVITMDGNIPTMNIYTAAGENASIDFYAVKSDALGDHIDSCYFKNWKQLVVTGTGVPTGRSASDVGRISRYEVYKFDASWYQMNADDQARNKSKYLFLSGTPNSNSVTINFPDNTTMNPNIIYSVDAYFALNPEKRTFKAASCKALYDTADFKNNYTYNGTDLGVTFDENGYRTFKLWAPTAARVVLRLYRTGTPSSLLDHIEAGANFNTEIEMNLGANGVWEKYVAPGEPGVKSSALTRKYYTFLVTNSNGTAEVVDPYAIATGVNAARGYTYNRATHEADPEGWNEGKGVDEALPTIKSANNLSVYEAHIRDLTADKTWKSNKGNRRGGYNAFAEEGTTYTGNGKTVKTGFDHIKELGVNAIQLLPVYDQDNDERIASVYSSTEEEGTLIEKSYNWGYNPATYNVVEGAYASDPSDPLCRIREYKNLVLTAAKSGIRIIMDVVYNHMASAANSAFTKIIPGYFFRTDANGNLTDGSGVGNEVATERPMASKFIAQSVAFWAEEYRIKGFRFDLMGVIDINTMKAVRTAVNKVDATTVLYGEGWLGGGSALPGDQQSTTGNVYAKLNTSSAFPVGAFNDAGRDGTKGNTKYGDVTPETAGVSSEKCFLTQGSPSTDAIYNTLTQILGENRWANSNGCNPNQTVNYVACHDNYTLYDQLAYQFSDTMNDNNSYVKDAVLAAQAIATFGQGIAFINGGDEIFRRKLIEKGNPLFDDLVASYKHATNGKDSWIEGDGIKLTENKWLVRNSYKYGDAVNSFKWDRKAANVDYFNRFKALFELRSKEMGNTLGQSKTQVDNGQTWCWDHTDLQPGTRILAGGFIGQKDSKGVYLFLANDLGAASGTTGIGNGSFQVLYSSNGKHSAGSSFSVSDNRITVYKYECLIVRRTSGQIK